MSFASILHSSKSTQYALALVVTTNAQLMSLKTDNLVQPPSIEEPTVLPMRIQPADQIIIRAVITSSTPHLFINWMHNNITYVDHKKEDPICPGTEDKVRLRIVVYVKFYHFMYPIIIGVLGASGTCYHFQNCTSRNRLFSTQHHRGLSHH